MSNSVRIGATMYIAATILVIAMLTMLFSDALQQQSNPNSKPNSVIGADGRTSILLQRNRAGHYVFNGKINGHAAEFLLDTGATSVSVSASFAERVGLNRGTSLRAVTANGVTTAYHTRIDTLAIGDIEEHDLAANIVPNMPDDQVLLGMSFLKRLDFSQRGDTLVLTQRMQ